MTKKIEAGASPAERLAALFRGNTRSSGRYDPKRDRGWTEDVPVTLADWNKHITGACGVGVVPIQDDDTCEWAALDLDNHGTDEDLPIAEVEKKGAAVGLPLLYCRSKSGGIHAYLFLQKPTAASRVRTVMAGYATALGFGGCEVFPKQAHLPIGRDQKRMKGNWINLPYAGGDETNRYCVHDGKKLTLQEFVDVAEKWRVAESALRALVVAGHAEAPPCVQHMISHGVAQGHRNEGMYNVVVYLRKVDPATAEAKATELNQTIFTRALPRAELGRTINSALRDSMQYRCDQEPIRSLCQRDDCLKRKFGITPADAERLSTVEAIPPFTNLVKYVSEPVRWDVDIDGVRISNIDTEALLDWRAIRNLIAERLTKVVPMIKNQEWERILQPLMKEARIVETPDDASISGVVRERLKEFASKTDLVNAGQDADDRKALLRGLPVVAVVDGERCVVFRGQDFINYLKRTKSEELKGINLWMALKNMGVASWRCRPGKGAEINPIDVWTLPIKTLLAHLQPVPKKVFKSDL